MEGTIGHKHVKVQSRGVHANAGKMLTIVLAQKFVWTLIMLVIMIVEIPRPRQVLA